MIQQLQPEILKEKWVSGIPTTQLAIDYEVSVWSIIKNLREAGITEFRRGFQPGHKSLNGMLGKKHSIETKELMRKHSNPWNRGTSKTKITFICEGCGVKTTRFLCGRTEVKYCSNDCSSKVLKGERNGNWKGGHTPLFVQIRHSRKYRNWRTNIFKRDNYTCQNCDIKGGRLEVHHIKTLKDIVIDNQVNNLEEAYECEELWRKENGVTYCIGCHSIKDYNRKLRPSDNFESHKLKIEVIKIEKEDDLCST